MHHCLHSFSLNLWEISGNMNVDGCVCACVCIDGSAQQRNTSAADDFDAIRAGPHFVRITSGTFWLRTVHPVFKYRSHQE